MIAMTYEILLSAKPCRKAIIWLMKQQNAGLTLAQAWEMCPRADWMYWMLDALDIELTEEQDLRLQLLALQTPLSNGKVILDLITDERSLQLIELKRQKLSGEKIDEQKWNTLWTAAQDAVWTVAWASAKYVGWAELWDPAKAAMWAATWVAAGVAQDAMMAAVKATVWCAKRDALDDAAPTEIEKAASAWQADRLRQVVGNPFQEEIL